MSYGYWLDSHDTREDAVQLLTEIMLNTVFVKMCAEK